MRIFQAGPTLSEYERRELAETPDVFCGTRPGAVAEMARAARRNAPAVDSRGRERCGVCGCERRAYGCEPGSCRDPELKH